MKKFFEEFKAFAMRGNVIDMAVGVVIGGAFGKITNSVVNDIIMPLISMLTGGVDFSSWKWVLKEAVMEGKEVIDPEIAVNYGNLIAVVLDFIIIAFADDRRRPRLHHHRVRRVLHGQGHQQDARKALQARRAGARKGARADEGRAAARRDPRPFEGAEQMNELLLQGLSELGLDVSRAETLERFSSLLLEKNQVMNLTAITEPDAVAQLHLLDSAALLPFVDLTGKTVVDVGTGAGFPGMPLRILEDDFDLTLLDSLGKRVKWLSEVCDELQLKRVQCVHARAEEFAMQHREQFDIATSRAVAQLSILSELCLPLIKVGGQFVAMKSVDTEEEITAAKSAIKTLGGRIVKVEDYNIPTSDVVHRLVLIEKVSPTPRAYPRAFAKIKKAPL